MKRADLWLAIVLSLTAGLLLGLYFGRSFANEGTAPMAVTNSLLVPSESTPLADEPARNRTAQDWLQRYTSALEQAIPGQPTPRLNEAIVEAFQAPGHYCSHARLLLLIDGMRKEDFPVAIEIFRRAKTGALTTAAGGNGHTVWNAFWQRFGELDPATAIEVVRKHRDISYPGRDFLEKHLFSGMSRKDPRVAAEAFLAHPDLPNRDKSVTGLMREWAIIDSKAAADWAQNNLQDGLLGTAFYGAAMGLAKSDDISAVIAYAQAAPQGIPRKQVVLSAKDIIRRSPDLPAQQLLDFVAATRGLGEKDHQFDVQMAKRAAVNDPYLAANFFVTQPAADTNDHVELRAVLQSWLSDDRKAAESWAKGQKDTLHYEVVAEELVRGSEEAIPDAAPAAR
jgi:hypothetical protein